MPTSHSRSGIYPTEPRILLAHTDLARGATNMSGEEWIKTLEDGRKVKFIYQELPEGAAFLTAQVERNEVVYSVVLTKARNPLSREDVESHSRVSFRRSTDSQFGTDCWSEGAYRRPRPRAVLFVSIASAAESFRSTCGSLRRAPEYNKQRSPTATPQIGQGTARNSFGARSLILIETVYRETLPKTVHFRTHCIVVLENGRSPRMTAENLASRRCY